MWNTIATILRKDLMIEWRTREAFVTSFVFSLIMILIFNFTLDLSSDEALRFAPGFLWITFVFAGILSLNRSFALEREENAAQALMVAPIDRGALYLGKFFGNVIFMLVTEAIILPIFAIFFNVSFLDRLWLLVLILFLGTVGFASTGTLLAAIAAYTRAREVILPTLLLPITVPVLIAAVETTAYALGVQEGASFGFVSLIVYDVVSVTLCFVLSDFVFRE